MAVIQEINCDPVSPEAMAERTCKYYDAVNPHAGILSEKEYQHFIMDRLSGENGYVIR